MRVSEMLTGVRGDLAVKIFGTDLATLNRLAGRSSDPEGRLPGKPGRLHGRERRRAVPAASTGRPPGDGPPRLTVDEMQNDLRAAARRAAASAEVRRPAPHAAGAARVPRPAPSPQQFAALRITTAGRPEPCRCQAAGHADQRADGPVKVEPRERHALQRGASSNVAGRDLVGFVEDAQARVAESGAAARRATASRGAASSRTSSAPRPASRWSCRSRSALIFLLLFATFGSLRQAVLVFSEHPVRDGRRHRRAVDQRASTCRCRRRSASSRCWASRC
jgi:cobalt-zinc-cadmium resistance protein CzcA